MTSPGAANRHTIVIDGKTFYLAESNDGRPIHDTVQIGRDLKETWDFQQPSFGMGETTKQTPTGYYFTDNMDWTKRGLRLGPKVNTIAMAAGDIPTDRVGFFFECEDTAGDPRLYFYCATSITNVRITKFNPVTDARITNGGGTQPEDFSNGTATNNNAGRPETFDGFPYICIAYDTDGQNTALQQLTTCSTSTTADDWTEISNNGLSVDMLLASEALDGTSQLIRATNVNKLQLVASDAPGTGPLDDDNWAPTANGGHEVGINAPHRVCLGGANAGGIVYISKAEGLFTFDNTGNSWPCIPFAGINHERPRHGVLCFAYGNIVFWGHASGLYRIIGLAAAKPVGPDAMPGYEDVPQITAPIRFQHYSGVAKGEWLYFDYTDDANDNNSYILAAKLGPHPSGHPLIIHTIVKRSNQIRSLYIDGQDKLRWAEPGQDRIAWIQLAPDGSPGPTRGAATTATYEWYSPEVDFGEPEITKQLRYAFLEIESGDSAVSWQLKCHRDSGSAENVDSAVTTTQANDLNWTVGTTDTCRRARFRLTVTGTDDHDATDPKALRLVVYARTPDVLRVILTPLNPAERKKRTEIAKIARKWKSAGPITVREPSTNETFTAYIKGVNEVADGIEVVYERWQVAA